MTISQGREALPAKGPRARPAILEYPRVPKHVPFLHFLSVGHKWVQPFLSIVNPWNWPVFEVSWGENYCEPRSVVTEDEMIGYKMSLGLLG
jgi:hypothetical protein